MIFVVYSLGLLILASLPALLVVRNLPLFYRLPIDESLENDSREQPPISILIPARNEEMTLADSIQSILDNNYSAFELVVMDDASTDRTAEIVRSFTERDARVRLVESEELPAGWNGKQFACWQLAQVARYEWLLFLDADVRLYPDALKRLAVEAQSNPADLISGFPRQETESFVESLLIPMMYFVLLGYLPLDQMRSTGKPEFGAGCGQLFLARREAYFACDGHKAIALSRHDGLKLPRAFRAAGKMTDIFDGSDLATVRMYHGTKEVLNGLLKNATEGIASPSLIGIFTLLLLGGVILPVLSFPHAVYHGWPWLASLILAAATFHCFVARALIANRMRHNWLFVLLHPVSVAIFIGLQWYAFIRESFGAKPVAWRGRTST